MSMTIKDLATEEQPAWCGGCGDFGILNTLKMALSELGEERHNILIVTGIGCGSKCNHFIHTYGFEGLHGRPLPVATGAKLANPKLKVIVVAGDGDTYGIGGNHFLHSMRRNLDITLIVENNQVYGLTKGQVSPTSKKGTPSPSTPSGVIEEAINPMALAIAAGATFVARAYSFDMPHFKQLIVDAAKHKGFSLIDVFQPCPTYNRVNTMMWYKDNLYNVDNNGHNPRDRDAAIRLASTGMVNGKLAYGRFYIEEGKYTYDEDVAKVVAVPPVEQDIGNIDIAPLMQRFAWK
ncbi:MAG: 2-oxoacid:ferredoxin oxidoreductase subunit beta [Candidatus Aenigmarchaeota archaeon]|nr:2-oxoacid:ferredoxin oxidoreductase subunit beta [Candidatus Aenigmarchaeota archaeon]